MAGFNGQDCASSSEEDSISNESRSAQVRHYTDVLNDTRCRNHSCDIRQHRIEVKLAAGDRSLSKRLQSVL